MGHLSLVYKTELEIRPKIKFFLSLSQKRSSGTHVQGGSQQNFRTQVSLFRKSGNENQTPLEPGGIVQLGEELFLRAHVNSGDGKLNIFPKQNIFQQKCLS